MYGIPENLDLSSLKGDRLDHIALQEYQVVFGFDRGMSFVIEVQIDVVKNGSTVARWQQETGWSSVSFQNVIGLSVESFAIRSKNELNILLNDGWLLIIYDNSPQYESFHIYPQDIHI